MANEILGRVGFWRRVGAVLIDALCIAFPCSLLGGLLFAVSGGVLQMTSPGLQARACQDLTSYPQGLSPAPPTDSNYAVLCDSYFLAGRTGSVLIVGARNVDAVITTDRWASYLLTADGRTGAVDVSWITPLAFVIYLLLVQNRYRRTLGQRLMRSRLMLADNAEATRIPFRRLALRYAILLAGYVPTLILSGAATIAFVAGAATPLMFFAGVSGAWLLGAAWWGWNTVLIVRKKDPVYDRLARIAVVRTGRPVVDQP